MQESPDAKPLTPAEQERLNNLVGAFENAWKKLNHVDLNAFLPAAGDPLRPAAIRALVRSDMEIRYRRGRPLDLGHYLQNFPELGNCSTLPVNLLFEEYRLRQRFGQPVSLAGYRERFPAQYADLERLVRQSDTAAQEASALGPPLSAPIAAASPAPIGGQPTLATHGAEPTANRLTDEREVISELTGGYRLLRKLGQGTFGTVWEAEAPGGFRCAIKIIHRAIDSEEVQRERRSLDVVRRLQHPGLLQVTAAWTFEDRLIIAMELASSNLRERLRQCQTAGGTGIPIEELIRYLRDSAAALDYLHSEKALHRDVKPDNILLRGHSARLADFGLVRDETTVKTMNRPVGTPPYMAPEVWACRATPASDQYALACTYAELRRGKRPFAQRSTDELSVAHAVDPPDLSLLSEPEKRVLRRALAKEPTDRYPSCSDFVRDLEGAVGVSSTDKVENTLPTPAPAPSNGTRNGQRARRGVWVWGLMVLGVAVLGVAGALAAKHFFEPEPPPKPPGEPDQLAGKEKGKEEGKEKAGEKVKEKVVSVAPPKDKSRSPDKPPPLSERMVRRIGSEDVAFRLVRPAAGPPFYVMENKVWNSLFAAFAKAKPAAVEGSQWRLGALANGKDLGVENGNLPVFRVSRAEAAAFAEWIGGKLPTASQLDQAPRADDKDRGAIGRWREGPLPIVEGGSGIHDLDGNGREWTRTDRKAGAKAETLAVLRGRSYAAPAGSAKPDFTDPDLTPTQYPDHASPTTSFRVVIEPPGS
jgi:serine/threonine protein kinase